jgi:hypothetical protein
MKEFPRELRDYLRAINPMPHIHELEQRVKRFYCHGVADPDFQMERRRLFSLFSISKFFSAHDEKIDLQLIRMFCDTVRICLLIISVIFILSTFSMINLKIMDAEFRNKSMIVTNYLHNNYPKMDKAVVDDIQDCIRRCHYDFDNDDVQDALQYAEDGSPDNLPIIREQMGSEEDGAAWSFDSLVVHWLGVVLVFGLNPVSYRFNRARRLFWQMELYLREREKMAKSASSVNGAAGTNGH